MRRECSVLRGLNWELTGIPKAGGNSSSLSTQGLGSKKENPIRAGQTSSLIMTCVCNRTGGKWRSITSCSWLVLIHWERQQYIFNFLSSLCFHQTQEETGGSSVAGRLSPNLAQCGAPPGMGNLWLVIGWVLWPLNVHLGEVNQIYSGEN